MLKKKLEKLNFGYERSNVENLTPAMVRLINTFYCRGDCKLGCRKVLKNPFGPSHWQLHSSVDHPEFGNIFHLINQSNHSWSKIFNVQSFLSKVQLF